jgi:ABC-type transport system involved in multi-copper enzyme maturation permease subunit
MIAELKAEVRKLVTIRSTYIIIAVVLALEVFLAFFISGVRAHPDALHNPQTLASDAGLAIHTLSLFCALIAVLLLTHEFRYNTISYSLTLSNSRSKVLAAKIIVMSVFAVCFTLITGALSPLLAILGMNVNHLHLVAQSIPYHSILWRGLFYGWGYTMAGLVIATLVRNQIGAIVTLFIVPGTVEGLLSLLLKQNIQYLPFSALNVVIGSGSGLGVTTTITQAQAALVFSAYLVVGWIVAWVLFLRRDAV